MFQELLQDNFLQKELTSVNWYESLSALLSDGILLGSKKTTDEAVHADHRLMRSVSLPLPVLKPRSGESRRVCSAVGEWRDLR